MDVNTNFVGPITPGKFLEEKYFFTFINKAIREIKTYTKKEKSGWFGHL